MKARGFERCFRYLDDFLVMADTKPECQRAVSTLTELLCYLRFEIATERIIAPAMSVKYLGLIIDSAAMELLLPQDKLDRLCSLVGSFASIQKVTATRHELDSLCGVISHASKVVRGGHTFSRRLINLTNSIAGKHPIITLPDWFKSDLQWWLNFCEGFNGKAPIIDTRCLLPYPVETDSSMSGFDCVWKGDFAVGSWSKEATVHADIYVSENHWASGPEFVRDDPDINLLELWPILVSD